MNAEQMMSSRAVMVSPGLATTPYFPEDRLACIAEAAYFRAEKRGFEAGHELEDWLAAEAEVDARLIGEKCAY